MKGFHIRFFFMHAFPPFLIFFLRASLAAVGGADGVMRGEGDWGKGQHGCPEPIDTRDGEAWKGRRPGAKPIQPCRRRARTRDRRRLLLRAYLAAALGPRISRDAAQSRDARCLRGGAGGLDRAERTALPGPLQRGDRSDGGIERHWEARRACARHCWLHGVRGRPQRERRDCAEGREGKPSAAHHRCHEAGTGGRGLEAREARDRGRGRAPRGPGEQRGHQPAAPPGA